MSSPAASQSSINSYAAGWGPSLISTFIASAIYGISVLQTFYYYTHHGSRDKRAWLILVGVIFVLDSVAMGLFMYCMYYYLVTSWGLPEMLKPDVKEFPSEYFITTVLAFIVQNFYINTIRALRAPLVITVLLFLISLTALVSGFILPFIQLHIKYVDLIVVNWLNHAAFNIARGTALACDVGIVIALCWLFAIRKMDVRRANNILDGLILFAVQRGVLQAFVQGGEVIFYAVKPSSIRFLPFHVIVSRIYCTSLLATLNSREYVLSRGKAPLQRERMGEADVKQLEAGNMPPLGHSDASAGLRPGAGKWASTLEATRPVFTSFLEPPFLFSSPGSNVNPDGQTYTRTRMHTRHHEGCAHSGSRTGPGLSAPPSTEKSQHEAQARVGLGEVSEWKENGSLVSIGERMHEDGRQVRSSDSDYSRLSGYQYGASRTDVMDTHLFSISIHIQLSITMSKVIHNAATDAVESGIYASVDAEQKTNAVDSGAVRRNAERKASEVQSVASDAADLAQLNFPSAGEQTASTADVLQNDLAGKTNAASAEGQKDVESAKATSASYVDQAKFFAGSVLATAQGYVEAGQNKISSQNETIRNEGVGSTLQSAAGTALGAAGSALSAAHIDAAADAAQQYVQSAKETVQPHVDSAVNAARPYVEGAKEKAQPHVEAATNAAQPYVQSAKDAVVHGDSDDSETNFPRRQQSFVPFFTRANVPYRTFGRRLVWIFPVAGGVALYLAPPKPLSLSLPAIFSSPNLIPCPPPASDPPETQLVINSPDEENRTIVSRLLLFLRERIWEPILTARRFVHLFFIFIPVIITSPAILFGDPLPRHGGERRGAIWWYGFLVSALQRAGPTFIKLAQWAASRADLFSAELCARMGALHSNGMPHSIQHTRRVIERVFQRPFEDVFEEFDEKPIGVGAIAQVYRAVLRKDLIPPSYLNPKRSRPSGTVTFDPTLPYDPPPSVPSAAVAIKVLHPRVANLITRDLSIMRFFAQLVSVLPGMEWLSLPEEVGVFGGMMAEQLDLRHEAQNLKTFEHNFNPRKAAVSFPRPLSLFTSQDVLVEEFQNALPVETFLKIGGGPYDSQIAELGLDAFLNMLLLDNFVHSDLHPGNIMIKFYKPSTRFLLKGIWASIWGTKQPDSSLHLPDDAKENIDRVVDRLRELMSDPAAWRAELHSLSEQGYLPEIVFLDAGLVTTLNDTNRRNFLELFRAIAEFDGYRAGQLMVQRCHTPHLVQEPETFALRMQHLVLSVKRKTFSLGRIKISDILVEVLRAVREHHVKMEGDFVNTVISVLLLEGIGRQLNPDLDLFKSALPILRKLGRHMTAQESMESMKKLPRTNLGAYLKACITFP
ncbi:hypothetical protein EW145_g3443 [Phellinidium pouzarii]|uniref:ABC1 atypical kinase-like domain-containing protein n=1 Tax=Phellinidium pouzarii TaxID=167371 RepID=A0A4S4L7N2_9AGAM|nr:hypothetical protein EW145_g3443 [Phellinidium pouzarii]